MRHSQVRITAGRLGLMRDLNQSKFEPEVAEQGDLGTYESSHPELDEWHILRFGDFYCPAHRSQFEFVSVAERLV